MIILSYRSKSSQYSNVGEKVLTRTFGDPGLPRGHMTFEILSFISMLFFTHQDNFENLDHSVHFIHFRLRSTYSVLIKISIYSFLMIILYLYVVNIFYKIDISFRTLSSRDYHSTILNF